MRHPVGIRIASQDNSEGTRLGHLRLTGFVERGHASLRKPRRVLESYAVAFVHGGAGIYVDDDVGEHPVGPGDAILVVPGHPHWYGPRPREVWDEIFVVFDGPVFDTLRACGILDVRRPVRRVAPVDAWRARLSQLADRQRPTEPTERDLDVLELAALLVELVGEAEHRAQMPLAIRTACDLLAADLETAIDLRAVAAQTGLSYESFRKRFKSVTGRAPGAFRLDRRIAAARSLLELTTLTHAQIATTLGFADEYHFAKAFRARVGLPPGTFRRSRGENR